MRGAADWWSASVEECAPPLSGKPLGAGRGGAELLVVSLGGDILKGVMSMRTDHRV